MKARLRASAPRPGSQLEITPMTGEGLAQLVTDIVNAPASVIEQARRAVR